MSRRMTGRMPNGHPADHELLLAADAGDEALGRVAVERHLSHCEPCRARLDVLQVTLREAAEECQRLSGDDDAPLLAQRARLAQALRVMPAPRGGAWWQPLSLTVLPPWVVVAAAMIVVGLTASRSAWLTRSAGDGDVRASVTRELPAAALTPGAAAPMSVRELCAGLRPSRVVSADVRADVLRAYGMEDVPSDAYELDALITPELGGTTDARNLWPQRYASLVWHARIKDVLEERLAADVCAGRMDLQSAQRDLATDWVAAYRRYFNTDVPLQAHLRYDADQPELEIEIAAPRQPRFVAQPEALALMMFPASRPR